MLAQEQDDLPVAAAADLRDQPPLESKAPLVVDPAQQKCLDCRRLLLGFLPGGGHGRA
jgi:hypothetical protein